MGGARSNPFSAGVVFFGVLLAVWEAQSSCLLEPQEPFIPPHGASEVALENFGDQHRTQFWNGRSWSALITTHVCDQMIVDISLVSTRYSGAGDPRKTILTIFDRISSRSSIVSDVPEELRRGILEGRQQTLKTAGFEFEIRESDFHDILLLRYRSERF